MDLERDDCFRELRNLHDECKRCMYYHTTLKMADGSTMDGIIENVEPDRIIVLIGEDVMDQENKNESNEQRQYHNYNRPRMRYRRFRRQAFPLASLAALSLLSYPYITPPPYPYYPYYPYY